MHKRKANFDADKDTLEFTPLGSGQEVGRSCHILKFKGKTIMLDCGIHPAFSGRSALPFLDKCEPSEIDIVLISHFHLDHAAALPYFLAKMDGFKGKVYMTHPTKSIYKLILQDYVKVSSISADEKLYSQEDLNKSMDRITAVNYHEEVHYKGIKFWCYNAGHVLGAAMFMIEIAGVKILYTGDYSRREDRHLPSAETPEETPDVLIVESTYGVQTLPPVQEREKLFTRLVHNVVARRGRCLLPVFALGRAQELQLILDEYWENNPSLQDIPIYYASKLAKKCMKVYQTYTNMMNERVQTMAQVSNPFQFKHVQNLSHEDQLEDTGPCAVMASPGMLQNGLSRQLFDRWCTERRNGVVIPGYCVEGTLAKTIMAEPSHIMTLQGHKAALNMSVHYVSFSAHADFKETSEFIDLLRPPHVILVHGDGVQMGQLRTVLMRTYKDMHIWTPYNGQLVSLEFRAQKIAKVVGSLASVAPENGQGLSGLLVRKNFSYQLMATPDLGAFTPLASSEISQQMFFQWRQNREVLKFFVGQIYELVEMPRVMADDGSDEDAGEPDLLVHGTVTIKQLDRQLELTWKSDPVSDMVADSLIAVLMGVEANPSAAKVIGQTKCGCNHTGPAHAKEVSWFLSKKFGLVRPGEQPHTLNIMEHSQVAAVVDVENMSVVQCQSQALRKQIEQCLRRIRVATQPITAPERQQQELVKKEEVQSFFYMVWTCAHCTFINEESVDRCDVCIRSRLRSSSDDDELVVVSDGLLSGLRAPITPPRAPEQSDSNSYSRALPPASPSRHRRRRSSRKAAIKVSASFRREARHRDKFEEYDDDDDGDLDGDNDDDEDDFDSLRPSLSMATFVVSDDDDEEELPTPEKPSVRAAREKRERARQPIAKGRHPHECNTVDDDNAGIHVTNMVKKASPAELQRRKKRRLAAQERERQLSLIRRHEHITAEATTLSPSPPSELKTIGVDILSSAYARQQERLERNQVVAVCDNAVVCLDASDEDGDGIAIASGDDSGKGEEAEDEQHFEIEELLADRLLAGGGHEYLVKWEGYGHDDNSWEPEANLERRTVAEYWREVNEESNIACSRVSRRINGNRSRRKQQYPSQSVILAGQQQPKERKALLRPDGSPNWRSYAQGQPEPDCDVILAMQLQIQEENSDSLPFMADSVDVTSLLVPGPRRVWVEGVREGGLSSRHPGWNRNSCPVDPILYSCFGLSEEWDEMLICAPSASATPQQKLRFYQVQTHLRENVVNPMRRGEETEQTSRRSRSGKWVNPAKDGKVHAVLKFRVMLWECGAYSPGTPRERVYDFMEMGVMLEMMLSYFLSAKKTDLGTGDNFLVVSPQSRLLKVPCQQVPPTSITSEWMQLQASVTVDTRAMMVIDCPYGKTDRLDHELCITRPSGDADDSANESNSKSGNAEIRFSLSSVVRFLPHDADNTHENHFDVLARFAARQGTRREHGSWFRLDPLHGFFDPELVSDSDFAAQLRGEERLSPEEVADGRRPCMFNSYFYVRTDHEDESLGQSIGVGVFEAVQRKEIERGQMLAAGMSQADVDAAMEEL